MRKLLNCFKWLIAQTKRRSDADHVAEVVVYLDGRIIERKELVFDENFTRQGRTPYHNALVFANGVTSAALGMERRRMKGRK